MPSYTTLPFRRLLVSDCFEGPHAAEERCALVDINLTVKSDETSVKGLDIIDDAMNKLKRDIGSGDYDNCILDYRYP